MNSESSSTIVDTYFSIKVADIMVKDKKNTSVVEDDGDKVSYEDKLKFVSVIAKPMASKKLAKKVN